MRLAIIGAGNVGGKLGTAWAQKAGHEIFFGVRYPASDQTQAVLLHRRENPYAIGLFEGPDSRDYRDALAIASGALTIETGNLDGSR